MYKTCVLSCSVIVYHNSGTGHVIRAIASSDTAYSISLVWWSHRNLYAVWHSGLLLDRFNQRPVCHILILEWLLWFGFFNCIGWSFYSLPGHACKRNGKLIMVCDWHCFFHGCFSIYYVCNLTGNVPKSFCTLFRVARLR